MRNQQLDLFPRGGDTPLFGETAMKAQVALIQPREAKSPPRFFVCPTCQDTGKIKCCGKSKTTGYCPCAAGQAAQSRTTLGSLPESKRTKRRRELDAEPGGALLGRARRLQANGQHDEVEFLLAQLAGLVHVRPSPDIAVDGDAEGSLARSMARATVVATWKCVTGMR